MFDLSDAEKARLGLLLSNPQASLAKAAGNLFFDIGAAGATAVSDPHTAARSFFDPDAATRFNEARNARRSQLPKLIHDELTQVGMREAGNQAQRAIQPVIERYPQQAQAVANVIGDPRFEAGSSIVEAFAPMLGRYAQSARTDIFGPPEASFMENMTATALAAMPETDAAALVWHGSPNRFDRPLFDIDFMGTGEGAQAYGWGMYFADRHGVAKGYSNLRQPRLEPGQGVLYGGKPLDDLSKAMLGFHLPMPGSWYADMPRMLDAARDETIKWMKQQPGVDPTEAFKDNMQQQVNLMERNVDGAWLRAEKHVKNNEESLIWARQRYRVRKDSFKKMMTERGYTDEQINGLMQVIRERANNPENSLPEIGILQDFSLWRQAESMRQDRFEWVDRMNARQYLKDKLEGAKQDVEMVGKIKEFAETDPWRNITIDTDGLNANNSLFSVELPDEQIDKFLLWDKPFSQQPENVKAAFANLLMDDDPAIADYLDDKYNVSPSELLTGVDTGTELTGRELYNMLRTFHEQDILPTHPLEYERSMYSNEAAARWLASQGVPGNKFRDYTRRRGAEGTHNYVVFEDHDIPQILSNHGRAELSRIVPPRDLRNMFTDPVDEVPADEFWQRLKEIGAMFEE